MIYPGFVDICAALAERHMVSVDTNLSMTRVVREFVERVPPQRVYDLYIALHVEERERKGQMEAFAENVRLLLEKGYELTVNYVLHPTLVERYPADKTFYESRGVPITPRPFKGKHEGRHFPADYDTAARAILAERPRSGRKMVYNFQTVPCRAGRDLLRMEPDGEVLHCPGDLTSHGNVLTGVRRNQGARPCRVERCPCFGIDYVQMEPAQERFTQGLAHYVLGEAGLAERAFGDALELDPLASNAMCNLGLLALEAGRPAEGLEWVERALELHPRNTVYGLNAEACRSALAGERDEEQTRGRLCVDVAAGNHRGVSL
jgi:tetratricopeptide (TPR) repeat protein